MSNPHPVNLAASLHKKLLNQSKERGRPFAETLVFYAIERFLFRLSQSPEAGRFVLKGALALQAWNAAAASRPTRDIDLLGRMDNDLEAVRLLFAEVCRQSVPDDGLVFDPATVATARITEDADYEGVRVAFLGMMGKARIPMQIDIGFGDVVTPPPVYVDYPTLMGQPAPRLLTYNRETAIAEKLEAMVSIGAINSRMKDFFDIWMLARHHAFDGKLLTEAVARTFAKRGTPADAHPVCFSTAFSQSAIKATQWNAFIKNAHLADATLAFPETVAGIVQFLGPVLEAIAAEREFAGRWSDGAWR